MKRIFGFLGLEMADALSLFQGTEHAAAYKKYRGGIPDAIVKKILAYLSEKLNPEECVGIDVGCGSGQSTVPFSTHLKEIIAIDASPAQILESGNIPQAARNIRFQKGRAEALPVSNNSVHLIIVMNALHWFRIEDFFKEVDRVLQPNGVLAVCMGSRETELVGHEEKTVALFKQFSVDTASFWNPKVELANNLYRDVRLPFPDSIRDESVATKEPMTVEHLMGRLKTLSGVVSYSKSKPRECKERLQKYQRDLMTIVGNHFLPKETNVVLKRRYVLLMGRKPEKTIPDVPHEG